MPETPAFPRARWAALAWLAVWFPAYWMVWGWPNFLLLCDAAVILTCVGLWRGSSLLLSSQALMAIFGGLLWCIDVGSRFLFGRHAFGGTEYMWDARFPLAVRLLSLFHFLLPLVLLWALRRVGYDRRAPAFQSGLTALLLVISRFVEPTKNLNFAFHDPLFGRAWGPAPLHLVVTLAVFVVLIYWPTHRLLAAALPPHPRTQRHGTNPL